MCWHRTSNVSSIREMHLLIEWSNAYSGKFLVETITEAHLEQTIRAIACSNFEICLVHIIAMCWHRTSNVSSIREMHLLIAWSYADSGKFRAGGNHRWGSLGRKIRAIACSDFEILLVRIVAQCCHSISNENSIAQIYLLSAWSYSDSETCLVETIAEAHWEEKIRAIVTAILRHPRRTLLLFAEIGSQM